MKVARTLVALLLLAAAAQLALAQGEAWLGVAVTTEGFSWNLDTGTKTAVLPQARVVRVEANGPAASAGIRVDDVILALDHEPITGGKELSDKVRLRQPGSMVSVRVKRRDDIIELKAVLGTRPTSRELGPGERPIKKVPVP